MEPASLMSSISLAVVPEQTTHTLDELVAYYTRTPFIVWISLLSLALAAVLALAHVTEWTAERSTLQASLTPRTPRHKRFRRWSQAARAPPLPPPPAFVPATTPALGREARYGTFGRQDGEDGEDGAQAKVRPELRVSPGAEGKGGAEVSGEAIERSRLMVGVAYGGASGTLSGLCLLFAKTGIELLILTVVGQNQVSPRPLRTPPNWALTRLPRPPPSSATSRRGSSSSSSSLPPSSSCFTSTVPSAWSDPP